MTAYISEFVAAIRHPEHEAGQESTFHVVITQWVPNPVGEIRPQVFGPVTPDVAEKAGFSLDQIIGEVTAAALRDRAKATQDLAETQRRLEAVEAERDAAKAEWTQMASMVAQAQEAVSTAQRAAGDAILAKREGEAREAALLAELEALKVEKPSFLSKVTFGLLGN